MLRKILSKTKYFLIVVLVGVLVLTLFPTILDGGSAEQVQSFVTRFYVQCLGRQPDSEGLNEWVGRLLNGSKTGADVAEGFVLVKSLQAKITQMRLLLPYFTERFLTGSPMQAAIKPGWRDWQAE